MKFKIEIDIPRKPIDKEWPSFFTIGSCFAQNQAERKRALGFDVNSNPFGVLYNPISIKQIFERCVNEKPYTTADFAHYTTYFSWEHHGDFTYPMLQEAVDTSNALLLETQKNIRNANVIVITYGTSLVYKHKGMVVANCHKRPNKEFVQEQLLFDEIKESISYTLKSVERLNAEAQVIFTLSPIRHLRSGVAESSRSKAVLLAAMQEVIDESAAAYFPSYEIFIDELRDYRFAKEDMTHPTPQAEAYIWNRFRSTYFSAKTQAIIEDIQKYNDFKNHRPKDFELHTTQLTEKRNRLLQLYPFLKIA